MNFRMATTQAGIPVIIQGAVNQPINQYQQPVVSGQTNPKTFPVRTLKIFGGIHVSCGILLGIFSVVGCVLDAIDMNEECNRIYDYNLPGYVNWYPDTMCLMKRSDSRLLFAFDVTCIICSGWVSFEMSIILTKL